MERREFLSTSLAAGTGALLHSAPAFAGKAPAETLDVAILGAGMQGRTLLNCLLAAGAVRVRAVCDIWEYRRTSALAYLKAFGQEAGGYEDYREMLEDAGGLHAAVVATPDFVHAEQTIASLNAGLHVYCEAPMAPTLAEAAAMAQAARSTGKLLQIGYQRRSDPRYRHARENLLGEAELTGGVTSASTQWNQWDVREPGWPRQHTIPAADLEKYGYADMREFRNWHWFQRYGAGPFASFGVHQVDVLNWLLGAPPAAVLAAGGADFYRDRQCYDDVTAIFEYPFDGRVIRAACQVQTTTRGTSGSFEQVAGTAGTIRLSDNPRWTAVFREPTAAGWDEWVRKGYLARVAAPAAPDDESSEPAGFRVQETGVVTPYEIPVVLEKPPLQLHLENFLGAVRGQTELHCPAETAVAAEAAVLRALEAVEARRLLPIET